MRSGLSTHSGCWSQHYYVLEGYTVQVEWDTVILINHLFSCDAIE